MRHLLVVCLVGCATPANDSGSKPGDIPQPSDSGGKGDGAVACGAGSCEQYLCAWDCSTAGQACSEACESDARADVFVQASVSGGVSSSVDSRQTPYKPKFSLDNVLIYGCELWHFSDGKQGFEIELTELIHSAYTVDPSDPTRYQRKLDVYFDGLQGAGDYKGQGTFAISSDADRAGGHFYTRDGCAVHVTNDRGGLSGTFACSLATDGGSTASMSGQFACPGNGTSTPNFVAWTPAS